jgi:metal-dependent amidase/aminoacylase/carboxypeptidase family protein
MISRSDDAAIRASVDSHETLIRETVAFIHAHPEFSHQELECSAYLQETLAGLGLKVERGLAGMETGFRATLTGGQPGRSVGITALYDAVTAVPPGGGYEAVHSCGHGPIAGGVVGAVAALVEHREQLAGRVVVMGCPADEIHAVETVARGSGKALSAAAGAWDDIDAAMYAHPEFIDTVSLASLWMRRLDARVAGVRSLAEGSDLPPMVATEAALRSARSLPAGRGMIEHLELDGDVEDGGGLVTRIRYLIWADDEPGLQALGEQLRADLPDADWTVVTTVPSIVPNEAVTAAVADAFRAAGRDFVADPPPLPFATDFGAVSRRVPSALIGVGRAGGWAFHTPLGADQFASEDGMASAIDLAHVLALSAARLAAPA